MDGVYQPIAIEALATDILQGHSTVLNLDLRWEHGQLKWYDSETGRHIATYDDQVTRADQAEVRADEAEAALRAEHEARTTLEARVRELEAQLRHRDS